MHYEVIGQDGQLKGDIIPWEQLPRDFPKSISDISLLKKNYLPAILDRTGAANHTPSVNHAANSLRTTARDYALFCSVWMQEKDCAFVKIAVEPTDENQKDSASSRYILTERGFFYYNKVKGRVQTIDLGETGSKLADLHRLSTEVIKEKPIDALSNEQLRQITAITGHTNPLQEAFRPTVLLTKDQWAIDMKVSETDRQHLAWGLGLGLQLDGAGEVISTFHSGDMNQWRGWAAMDVKTKSVVVYFANGNELKNGSGHGYGHVLAEVIVSSQVQLTHGLDCFFQKWGLARNVDDGWKEKEEADTASIDVYVRARSEIGTLEIARGIMQRYGSTLEDIKQEKTETEEKHKSPSPLQTTYKKYTGS